MIFGKLFIQKNLNQKENLYFDNDYSTPPKVKDGSME